MESMLSRLSLRTLLPQLRTPPTFSNPQRNLFRIGRKHVRKEKYVYRRKDKSKFKGNPFPTITAIMREDVKYYGEKGTVITVPRKVMRNKLVPKRLADYAIPENFAKYGIIDHREQYGDGTLQGGLRQYCPHVMKLLTQEDQSVTVKPRHRPGGPWMVTRHHVVHQFIVDWQLYVPLRNLQVKTCDGDAVDVITEYGSYTAEITVSNAIIEPPVVISLPLHVVTRSETGNDEGNNEAVVEGDVEETIGEEGEEEEGEGEEGEEGDNTEQT